MFLHSFSEISTSLRVFELLLPPMTIIASDTAASSDVSRCLFSVALQIELTTFILYIFFCKISTNTLNFFKLYVVCATSTVFSSFSGLYPKASSSESIMVHFPLHHPDIPSTSGCDASPITMMLLPFPDSSDTILCILPTKGHVASIMVLCLLSSVAFNFKYASSFTPCDLMIMTESLIPSASDTSFMIRTPFSSSSEHTISLCVIGPKVYTGTFFSSCSYTVFTAHSIPKQKPALSATFTVIHLTPLRCRFYKLKYSFADFIYRHI